MQNPAFEKILDQLASASSMTPAQIRAQMQLALESALEDPTPSVQAMWQSVPKKGTKPTLDEFMDYLIEKKMLLP